MAKKEFVFRGKKLEGLKALSLDEFLTLIPSRQRRSIQRMLAAKDDDVRAKLYKKIQNYKGGKIRTHCRTFVILPEMIGMTISVYNGKEFKDVFITEKMLGHVLGEFVLTRAFLVHGTAGIGASKSTKFASVRS
jgi:small subunit ribosomal protein S19